MNRSLSCMRIGYSPDLPNAWVAVSATRSFLPSSIIRPIYIWLMQARTETCVSSFIGFCCVVARALRARADVLLRRMIDNAFLDYTRAVYRY